MIRRREDGQCDKQLKTDITDTDYGGGRSFIPPHPSVQHDSTNDCYIYGSALAHEPNVKL